MIEKEINEFLVLKLEKGKTNIYVKGKKFLQCKRLAIFIPKQSIPIYDNIDSIDEAVDLYQKFLYRNKIVENTNALIFRDEIHDITPEQEFWGHCSNLQAWYEHNYDTRLLHSNLGFPLLKVLVDAGDPDAKRVFKTEVADRFESGHPNAIISIIVARLLDYFNPEEKKQLLQHNFPAISIYIENASKHYPNLFPYIFEERLVDYVNQEQKTQLKDLNYPVILNCLKKFSKSKYHPKEWLNSVKDILLDYLDLEEIKQLIQQNFPIILKDIEKIGKHYPNLFLYLFEEKLLHYLSKGEKMQLIQQNYPVVLKYIHKISNHYPDKFLYIFDAGILNYLNPEEKSQLIHQNYLIIFKNMQLILKPEIAEPIEVLSYPLTIIDIFDERLFDYLSLEEKQKLIQQNFPVLLIYIQGLSRFLVTLNYEKKSKSEIEISEKTLSYMYLTVIDAIKGTKLIDDFFKAIAEELYFSDRVFKAVFNAIYSIKQNQELKQNEYDGVTEKENVNKTSSDNWGKLFTVFKNTIRVRREELERNQEIRRNQELKQLTDGVECNKCGNVLPPKSMDILIRKERVYCPNCGRLVRRKFNPEARWDYLEAKSSKPKH